LPTGAIAAVTDEDETHKFLTSQGYRIISHVLLTSIYHVADKA
jgi:hypothetical protein